MPQEGEADTVAEQERKAASRGVTSQKETKNEKQEPWQQLTRQAQTAGNNPQSAPQV